MDVSSAVGRLGPISAPQDCFLKLYNRGSSSSSLQGDATISAEAANGPTAQTGGHDRAYANLAKHRVTLRYVTESMATIRPPFCGYNMHGLMYGVKRRRFIVLFK